MSPSTRKPDESRTPARRGFKALLLTIPPLLVGCGIDDAINTASGTARNVVEAAMRRIEIEGKEYREVLPEAIRDLRALGTDLSRDVADKMQHILGEATTSAGIGARCTTDYLRQGVVFELERLKIAAFGGTPTPLPPVICEPVPPSILIRPDGSQSQLDVKIVGYNMDEGGIKASVIGELGDERDVTGELVRNSMFLMTLNVSSANGVEFRPGDKRIRFRAPSRPDCFAAIIREPPPPPPTPKRRLVCKPAGEINVGPNPGAPTERWAEVESEYQVITGVGFGVRKSNVEVVAIGIAQLEVSGPPGSEQVRLGSFRVVPVVKDTPNAVLERFAPGLSDEIVVGVHAICSKNNIVATRVDTRALSAAGALSDGVLTRTDPPSYSGMWEAGHTEIDHPNRVLIGVGLGVKDSNVEVMKLRFGELHWIAE